jgi:hydrogenase maturation protease
MITKQGKTIGILGLGNTLLSDEGFGVHCVEHLETHYQFSENVIIYDGGTAGILLAPFIEQCDHIFVIDVVDLQDTPGSIHRFTDEDVRSGDMQTRMSPHQVGMLEILDICRIRGKAPAKIDFITVVPELLDIGMSLSPILSQRISDVLEVLLKSMDQLFSIRPEKTQDSHPVVPINNDAIISGQAIIGG